MLSVIVGAACLIWYCAVLLVSGLGYIQLYRHHGKRPRRAIVESLPRDQVPHVTVIRPVKGLEPELYNCLASTFHQSYPSDRLTVYLCVSSRQDPAVPTLLEILHDFPNVDARLFVEDEDPMLNEANAARDFGPNPKIRNMSRAYREAKGDIVWIVDCNVWVGKGVTGRMVDKLCGFDGGKKHKFVHQIPLVADITHDRQLWALEDQRYMNVRTASTSTSATETISHHKLANGGSLASISRPAGTQLEEMFLSSSHAKFYTAINTVLIAPCICGKSNMFRRSHLDSLTSTAAGNRTGIDYFSHNICEDHLIGELLWMKSVPDEATELLGKHSLVFGDPAIQPMADMSLAEYVARRVRWLRVRKFTVPAATLVEPGTESFLCSAYGAYAVTSLPWFANKLGIPQTWGAFAMFWLVSIVLWVLVDWTLFLRLHSMASVEFDENTPEFARRSRRRLDFRRWVVAWFGREASALPVWSMAVFGGVTVVWRGKKFRVGLDAKVRAVDEPKHSLTPQPRSTSLSHVANGHAKRRHD